MEKTDKKVKVEWYDSGNVITTLIIGVILLIIICSQSFVISDGISLTLLSSVVNHNSIYLFILIYFIFLKIPFGKKYFNYINLFLVFIYFITTITSLLTLVQAFSLTAIFDFVINIIFLVYTTHTLFRDTRVWKEYHLGSSPFNELSNEFLFNSILVVGVFSLAVNLINTSSITGVIISMLDFIYILLFGRYIYLYRDYLDVHKINSNNKGNFDEVRDKVQEVLDKTEIDEKIIEAKDKVVDVSKDVKKKVDDFIEDNEIDKKIDETSRNIKKSIDEFVEKNELDKKAEKIKKDIEKEFKGTKKKRTSTKKGDK